MYHRAMRPVIANWDGAAVKPSIFAVEAPQAFVDLLAPFTLRFDDLTELVFALALFCGSLSVIDSQAPLAAQPWVHGSASTNTVRDVSSVLRGCGEIIKLSF
jgi:hypothetical protein